MTKLAELKDLIQGHKDRYDEMSSESKWERDSIDAMMELLPHVEAELAGASALPIDMLEAYSRITAGISEDAAGVMILSQLMATSDIDFTTAPSESPNVAKAKVLSFMKWASEGSVGYLNMRKSTRAAQIKAAQDAAAAEIAEQTASNAEGEDPNG